MATLTSKKFNSLFSNGITEAFGGNEYTFINYDDDEFYFYYDAEQETFEGQGAYQLTEDQLNQIAKAIDERYQEDLKEKQELENAPFSIDYYEEYGVSRAMFI